ncbi:uncharacterized protein LOC144955362 [Lampetra fluviatilis]
MTRGLLRQLRESLSPSLLSPLLRCTQRPDSTSPDAARSLARIFLQERGPESLLKLMQAVSQPGSASGSALGLAALEGSLELLLNYSTLYADLASELEPELVAFLLQLLHQLTSHGTRVRKDAAGLLRRSLSLLWSLCAREPSGALPRAVTSLLGGARGPVGVACALGDAPSAILAVGGASCGLLGAESLGQLVRGPAGLAVSTLCDLLCNAETRGRRVALGPAGGGASLGGGPHAAARGLGPRGAPGGAAQSAGHQHGACGAGCGAEWLRGDGL